MPTILELKQHLEDHFHNDDVVAYDIWQVEDVQGHIGDDTDRALTQEQCESVLESMTRRQDANIGLNWEVMDVHIDMELNNA